MHGVQGQERRRGEDWGDSVADSPGSDLVLRCSIFLRSESAKNRDDVVQMFPFLLESYCGLCGRKVLLDATATEHRECSAADASFVEAAQRELAPSVDDGGRTRLELLCVYRGLGYSVPVALVSLRGGASCKCVL